jgi:hypothetical protein
MPTVVVRGKPGVTIPAFYLPTRLRQIWASDMTRRAGF